MIATTAPAGSSGGPRSGRCGCPAARPPTGHSSGTRRSHGSLASRPPVVRGPAGGPAPGEKAAAPFPGGGARGPGREGGAPGGRDDPEERGASPTGAVGRVRAAGAATVGGGCGPTAGTAGVAAGPPAAGGPSTGRGGPGMPQLSQPMTRAHLLWGQREPQRRQSCQNPCAQKEGRTQPALPSHPVAHKGQKRPTSPATIRAPRQSV